MVTGDSPILTLIVWVPVTILVMAGEMYGLGILANHMTRPWRMAIYLLAVEAAILIGVVMIITLYTLTRHPWL
jgi:hypothetical protein